MDSKILELVNDPSFIESILQLETPEEVQKAFADKGVTLSIGEIESIKKAVEAQSEGELTEDDLGDVVGGVDIAGIIGAVADGLGKLGDKIHVWTRSRW
ncbi:MAG: hypothetical protein LBN22_11695 [Clostridiales Family XIII bacterium]|jgi:hypothetical protein|nr:hypothetical protein [Clostridiales Family XIII bacterium]